MTVSRRGLLTGLGALFAAPAIVRASSLMTVKPWRHPLWPNLWPAPINWVDMEYDAPLFRALEQCGPQLTATEVIARQQEFCDRFAARLEALVLKGPINATYGALKRHHLRHGGVESPPLLEP